MPRSLSLSVDARMHDPCTTHPSPFVRVHVPLSCCVPCLVWQLMLSWCPVTAFMPIVLVLPLPLHPTSRGSWQWGVGGWVITFILNSTKKGFVSNNKMKQEKKQKTYLWPERLSTSLGPYFISLSSLWWLHPCLLFHCPSLSAASTHDPPHEQLLAAAVDGTIVVSLLLFHPRCSSSC
jgi:hypothetical protein